MALKRARSRACTSSSGAPEGEARSDVADTQPDITMTLVSNRTRAWFFMARIVRRPGPNWYHPHRPLTCLSGECSALPAEPPKAQVPPGNAQAKERQIREH